MEEKRWEASIQRRIEENDKSRDDLNRTINHLREHLAEGDEAKLLDEEIDALSYDRKTFQEYGERAQKSIIDISNAFREKKELTPEQASLLIGQSSKDIKFLESKLKIDLENQIVKTFNSKAEELLEKYYQYVKDIIDSVDGVRPELQNDILTGLSMNLEDPNGLVEKYKVSKKYVTSKKIKRSGWNPKRWFGNKYYYTDVTRYKQIVNIDDLADKYIGSVKENFYKNIALAEKNLAEHINNLKIFFKEQRKELDKKLQEKVEQINKYSKDKAALKRKITADKKKLKWLEKVYGDLDKILEI